MRKTSIAIQWGLGRCLGATMRGVPSWKSQCGLSPTLYLVKLSVQASFSSLSILHVLSKTKGSGAPTLRASATLSAPSPLALGSSLSMTEESSHQTKIPEHLTSCKCVYHSAYSLPGCMHGALGWHSLLLPQGAGCLNNISSSCPSQKPTHQDPHLHSLPLFGYISVFQDIYPELPLKSAPSSPKQ